MQQGTDARFAQLDDPAEREWLTKVSPSDVLANAHRIYDLMEEGGIPSDSYTRELAFSKAAEELGLDYEVLYQAWLHERATPAIAAGWVSDGGTGFDRDYGRGATGKIRRIEGAWEGWIEYEDGETGTGLVHEGDPAAAMAAVDEAHAEESAALR